MRVTRIIISVIAICILLSAIVFALLVRYSEDPTFKLSLGRKLLYYGETHKGHVVRMKVWTFYNKDITTVSSYVQDDSCVFQKRGELREGVGQLLWQDLLGANIMGQTNIFDRASEDMSFIVVLSEWDSRIFLLRKDNMQANPLWSSLLSPFEREMPKLEWSLVTTNISSIDSILTRLPGENEELLKGITGI